jgi:hypothetical protein
MKWFPHAGSTPISVREPKRAAIPVSDARRAAPSAGFAEACGLAER